MSPSCASGNNAFQMDQISDNVEVQNEFINELRQAAGDALANTSFGEALRVD